MGADTSTDRLVADLRALGRSVPVASPTPDLAASVTRRVAASAPPRAARRRQRPLVLAAAVAVATALLATPPVRATVADWFGFGGVMVRETPAPGPTSPSPPPSAQGGTDLRRAVRLVDFDVLAPAALGPPDAVEVSADRRVLSMSWGTGGDALRLDQFDGRIDYTFAKSAPGVEFTTVDGAFALWFDRPHEVVVLGPDGAARTETARLAGHTLIWEHGGTTLRLEGDIDLEQARAIAGSAAALP